MREYYRNELLPDFLLMGMPEDVFWRSTPRMLVPYSKAYEKKLFEIDRLSHTMGAYVYDAVGSALSGFGKKTKKYRDKPFSEDIEEQLKIERMTKEEKLEKVEEIFDMLNKNVK